VKKRLMFFAALVVASLGLATFAAADSSGLITFESSSSPAYTVGNIDGQNSWSNTGGYDANVANVSSFPAASAYGAYGDQALQISNAKTSGSFGDQTFAPLLANPAKQGTSLTHFVATFSIGTTTTAQQSNLSISVSPDNGQGARMSYLRFDDQADGVHVFFDDLRNTKAFKERDIATLTRGVPHTIGFSLDLKASTDSAKITIDGKSAASGTTWESYYPLAGEPVPNVATMLFRSSSTPLAGVYPQYPDNAGHGFLIDNLTYASS
jgi:hypothetical protein